MDSRFFFLGMALQAIIVAVFLMVGWSVSAPQQLVAAAVFLALCGSISMLKNRNNRR